MGWRTVGGCLVALSVLTCGGRPASPDARQGAQESSIRETFVWLPRATRDARAAAFSQQTGGTFAADEVTPFRGAIGRAHRTTPLKPAVKLSELEAGARGRAFAMRYGSAFGLSPADLGAMKMWITPTPLDGPHKVFGVSFSGMAHQAGYERFEIVARSAALMIDIAEDGEPFFVQTISVDFPELHLRTRGRLETSDPAIVARVVGQPLHAYDVVGSVPGRYESVYRRRLVGKVSPSDIDVRSIRPNFSIESKANKANEIEELTCVLVYEVPVTHAGQPDTRWTFQVDPDTGAIVQLPKPPRGPIQ